MKRKLLLVLREAKGQTGGAYASGGKVLGATPVGMGSTTKTLVRSSRPHDSAQGMSTQDADAGSPRVGVGSFHVKMPGAKKFRAADVTLVETGEGHHALTVAFDKCKEGPQEVLIRVGGKVIHGAKDKEFSLELPDAFSSDTVTYEFKSKDAIDASRLQLQLETVLQDLAEQSELAGEHSTSTGAQPSVSIQVDSEQRKTAGGAKKKKPKPPRPSAPPPVQTMDPAPVTSMGSPKDSPSAKKKNGRRLSVTSNSGSPRALGADQLASGGDRMFDVKVNGKKSAQLNLGGMGLQIFEKKGKPPTKSYLYQNMAGWQETPKGFELSMSDETEIQFSCKDNEGTEICELIMGKAMQLAQIKSPDGIKVTPPNASTASSEALGDEPAAEPSAVYTEPIHYLVLATSTVRSGPDANSDKVGEHKQGKIIDVLHERINSDGLSVVQTVTPPAGWVKLKTSKGKVLLERKFTAGALELNKQGAVDDDGQEDQDDASNVSGYYKVIRKATVRTGFDMESPKAGNLPVGQVIDVLGARSSEGPGARVRFAFEGGHSWTSSIAKTGNQMLERTDEPVTQDGSAQPTLAPEATPEPELGDDAPVTAMGSQDDATPTKKKNGRRLSLTGSSSGSPMALGADRLASGGEKMFDVKVNGKKSAQLNLGGMSLQIFEKKGKPPTKSYLYQNMAGWQETPKGFELSMTDGTEIQFSCKDGDGKEICELIMGKATELAQVASPDAPGAKPKGEGDAATSPKPEVVTAMGSQGDATPTKKKRGRRMSLTGNKQAPALGADQLASGGDRMFDVKVNGKKSAQLNLGGMSLQIFEKKGKPPTKSYLYQNMAGWQETPKGFELSMTDGTEIQFSCKNAEGGQIVAAITAKAMELAAVMDSSMNDEEQLEQARDTSEGETSGMDDGVFESPDSDDSFMAAPQYADDSPGEAEDFAKDVAAITHEEAAQDWSGLSIGAWLEKNGAGQYTAKMTAVFEDATNMDEVADIYDLNKDSPDELADACDMDMPTAERLWAIFEKMKTGGDGGGDARMIESSFGMYHHSDDDDEGEDEEVDFRSECDSGTDDDDME